MSAGVARRGGLAHAAAMASSSDRFFAVCAALIALAVAGCADHPARPHSEDAYQACLDHAYQTGDVGVYGPNSLERRFPGDRDARRSLPSPSRLNWPQSPADQCRELRARGLL